MKGEYIMYYTPNGNPMELCNESINRSNLIGEVANYDQKELLLALREVTKEEVLRIPELIDTINKQAFFTDLTDPSITHHTYASKDIIPSDNLRHFGNANFYDNLTKGYLVLAYLELIGHRPLYKEAINNAEALELYNGLREVVLSNEVSKQKVK